MKVKTLALWAALAVITIAHANPVVPYNGAQYRDPAGLSAADAKRQLELQEEQAADTREIRDVLRALAEKHGVALPKAARKGLDPVTVVNQHCASCHKTGNAKGDLILVNEDGKLNHLRGRDWQEVLNRVEKGSMPPKPRRELTADEKAAFKR